MPKVAKAAIKVPLKTLVGLLGKRPKDPEVQAAMAKLGQVTFKSDFIIAKDAGFDFSVDQPANAKGNEPKVLTGIFLFRDGQDRHRGFTDLPKGLTFATSRAELLAKAPPPESSWKMGKGKVPVDTDGVGSDHWELDGLHISASYYKDGGVGHYYVKSAGGESGAEDLSTYPLHFETNPADAPPDAKLVGMALLVAWAADRFGLPEKHAKTELGKQLVARKISPRTFLVKACESTLTSLDFVPSLGDFLSEYNHHVIDDEGVRDKAEAQIAKLLKYARKDRRNYTDDFLGTFKDAVENPFYVPDSWDAVDRIAPVIDARLADFKATGYLKVPDLKLYEKAAKARDKVKVTPMKKELAKASVDATLADDLVALIGKPLTDKHVKEVLTRAGLPIGKRIDEQANPAIGVSYMGTKFDIAGKRQLGFDAVTFYANKQKSYIRGLHAEVQFVGYPGPLPRGLAFGDTRDAVVKKLGKPTKSSDDTDYYWGSKTLRMNCEYVKGKLVEIYFAQPKDY